MDKKQIQIGMVYSAKIGGSFLAVRIDKSLGHGRYEGAAQPSGKTVKVSTEAIKGDGETLEQWKARGTPTQHDLPAPHPAAKVEKPKAATTKAKAERKLSGLGAAARVLAEAGHPMNTSDMVEGMLAKGLWKTGGKTPAATIYAAIIREITTKAKASRFRKPERGMFELSSAAKEA